MSQAGPAPVAQSVSRVDMHCHSTASDISKLGVQRSLGLPECATPPEEVYALAKRRGMDFVTITDHDTIDGGLAIADRPDVFLSEELTAWFAGEPRAVHILCYGVDLDDHGWLQAHAGDVERCAAYLHENEITCALAHPFYAVEAPLTAGHRRRLAQLFPIWEVRNGARARELNAPAALYIETHGGTGIGGSDDHAGVDIGRTFTETAAARTPAEFLANLRAGAAAAGGEQGGAPKWAHAAMALAIRTLGVGGQPVAPTPTAVLSIVERIMREGHQRRSEACADLRPQDARALLRTWLETIDIDLDEAGLLAWMQSDGFAHADLFRRARRVHERRLADAVHRIAATAAAGGNPLAELPGLFDACLPAVPYAPAAAFLGREKGRLAHRDGEPLRVALVADGVGGMHGVTHTLEEIRERGVPGFEVEVVGTDANVDRRMSAVAEIDIPYYAGLKVGVPSLPAIVEALAEGRYDLVHLCSPGPAGVAAAAIARGMELPILGSYHTELAAYTALRTRDAALAGSALLALSAFYGQCDVVLSPSAASDAALRELGIEARRVGRWDRGVDVSRFAPSRRREGALPGEINVLYVGRQTLEKGVDLLADAFLEARASDPRLHLCLAGGGPEQEPLRARLGEHATFLGWLHGDELAAAYASADMFLFASRTDTFGQVILEAQASGLPVLAVDEGGPRTLIRDGVSGMLRAGDRDALSRGIRELAGRPQLRRRLARGGLEAVRERTWDASLSRLAEGYRRALTQGPQRLRDAA